MRRRNRLACVILLAVVCIPMATVCSEDKPATGEGARGRPLLAIWRDSDGYRSGNAAPYLRVAIWEDGRVLFAKDTKKWGHELFEGRIAAYRVDRLKEALAGGDVFNLKGHCYLGPDMPVDCIMIDLGEKKQMLYWVEGQMSWMESKPHRLKFAECWKTVNDLAIVACPDKYEAASEPFQKPPRSWYLKKMIQSE